MIRAVLLALGLVTGPIQVYVEVDDTIHSAPSSIEFFLDGEAVATISEPPWHAEIDLGSELRPRELLVVSRDGSGAELDRRLRTLNAHEPEEARARDATPITVLLDVAGKAPDGIETFFEVDGAPAEVVDVTYPDAEVWVVRDPDAQRKLDYAAALVAGGYVFGMPLDGDTLRAGFQETRQHLMQSDAFLTQGLPRFPMYWQNWLDAFEFEEGTQMRLVSPMSAPVSHVQGLRRIFRSTGPKDAHEHGLLYHAYATPSLIRWVRLADAVGLAGLEATAQAQRRAVIAIVHDTEAEDESLYDASKIRRYLAELGVPLFVWTVQSDAALSSPRWGPVHRIEPVASVADVPPTEPGFGYLRPLGAAHLEVRQTLERQRIVWIRGRHLPGDVRLAADARGVSLVSGQIAPNQPSPDSGNLEDTRDTRNTSP